MSIEDFANRYPRTTVAFAIAAHLPLAAYLAAVMIWQRLRKSQLFWRMVVLATIFSTSIFMIKAYVEAARCLFGR